VALRTLVGKVTVLAALEASDLVQGLEPVWPSITHWVHSVIILGVRHKCLPWFGHLLIPKLLRHLRAVADLVPHLTTIMTGDDNLLPQLSVHVWRCWQLKSWVGVWAAGTCRAETSKIVDAKDTSHMAVAAVGTVAAEPSVIPRTVADLGLWVNVEERTFFVMAGIKPGIEVALGHLAHVVLVQELALVPLLTEAPQPVLTHDGLVPSHMTERTRSPPLTR